MKAEFVERSFDYVIVGAGSAGCVLANRLSADPSVRVLLLEAGGEDRDPLIALPFGAGVMAKKGLYDWADVSEADGGLGGRALAVPHGKVIGGTSSINFMAAVRGHPADYQAWVEAGAAGWGFDDVLPFFRECETWAGGSNAWRGGTGELGVTEASGRDPFGTALLDAAAGLGHRITPDYNAGDNEGFGPIQYTLRRGRRSSASAAFLRPARARSNLAIETGAHATALVFDGDRKVAGVQYRQHDQDRVARSGRTVLCLGAINTPHLLMLSGIGPADHLQALGIRPRADLPVGRGLQDHLGTLSCWSRSAPGAFHRSLRLDRLAGNMVRAIVARSGPAAELPAAIVGFARTRSELRQPDIQIIIPTSAPDADAWFPGIKPAYRDGYAIRAQLVGQRSRGEVRLRSANSGDRPRIIYNSLSAPEDIVALRAGTRLAWAIGNSPALAGYRAAQTLPADQPESDEDVDAFIRSTAIQLYHPAATCRMGSGPDAVLLPDLSVRGIGGLSVVDASAMPRLASGNPNLVIMMMAAKAATILRAETRA